MWSIILVWSWTSQARSEYKTAIWSFCITRCQLLWTTVCHRVRRSWSTGLRCRWSRCDVAACQLPLLMAVAAVHGAEAHTTHGTCEDSFAHWRTMTHWWVSVRKVKLYIFYVLMEHLLLLLFGLVQLSSSSFFVLLLLFHNLDLYKNSVFNVVNSAMSCTRQVPFI